MDKFKFADVWDQISAARDQLFPSTAKKTMADTLRKFLKKKLGQGPGKEAAKSACEPARRALGVSLRFFGIGLGSSTPHYSDLTVRLIWL
ncbi:MAG: hypothetical protein K2Z80_18835 [Xanthobacteraceae bacterium]|nr:hypothetical protein [Xanthobacteraceae bacterium]